MDKLNYSTWSAGRNTARMAHYIVTPAGQDVDQAKVVIVDPQALRPTLLTAPSPAHSRVARESLAVRSLSDLTPDMLGALTGTKAGKYLGRALSVAERRSGRVSDRPLTVMA